jgi:hypothetical protein
MAINSAYRATPRAAYPYFQPLARFSARVAPLAEFFLDIGAISDAIAIGIVSVSGGNVNPLYRLG